MKSRDPHVPGVRAGRNIVVNAIAANTLTRTIPFDLFDIEDGN